MLWIRTSVIVILIRSCVAQSYKSRWLGLRQVSCVRKLQNTGQRTVPLQALQELQCKTHRSRVVAVVPMGTSLKKCASCCMCSVLPSSALLLRAKETPMPRNASSLEDEMSKWKHRKLKAQKSVRSTDCETLGSCDPWAGHLN